MMDTLPALPLAEYSFVFEALQDVELAAFPGGLWHSVFGRALRDQVCVAPGLECARCMLLHHCDYSHLFGGPRPPKSEVMRKYDTIPVPVVLRYDNAVDQAIPAGSYFAVSMIIVGQANEKLPVIIHTMTAVGKAGFGKRRSKAALIEVTQQAPSLPTLVMARGRMNHWTPPAMPEILQLPESLRITFMSPYKQTGKSTASDEFDLPKFIMAVVRRISMLQYFYTGTRLEADFAQLKSQSQAPVNVKSALKWRPHGRYSASHGKRVDTSGWLGSLDVEMAGAGALIPFLYLGQWLNVGKNASMGFGRYQLTALARLREDTGP